MQTLTGGNYEVVDKQHYTPNPDWWTALLWKRTMGVRVLGTKTNSSSLQAFVHCAAAGAGAGSGAVTLAFVNPSLAEVSVVPGAVDVLGAETASSFPLFPRQEYILTADAGDETKQSMLLNGQLLTYGGGSKLGPSPPRTVTSDMEPLVLPPHSYGFVVFENAKVKVC